MKPQSTRAGVLHEGMAAKKLKLLGAVYLFILCYLMYTCLWCFTSVFAASMAAKIPLPFVGAGNQFTCDLYTNQSWDCRLLYLEHLAVFACICVPLLRRRMPGLGMKTILR